MAQEQKVEVRARAIYNEWGMYIDTCRRIARAELEREGKLVEALRELLSFSRHYTPNKAVLMEADDAVRKWEAEFALPVRTLEQVARDIVQACPDRRTIPTVGVPLALLDELSAALSRAGKGA